MKNKNATYIFYCILINLVIGNSTVFFLLPDTSILYHLIISTLVTLLYLRLFSNLKAATSKISNWKLFFRALIASLLCMIIACIFTSIANRLPHDNIVTAGIKGILPLSIFALFFSAPVWILISIFNFLFFKKMVHTEKNNLS